MARFTLFVDNLRHCLAQLRRSERGNVAIIFGLSVLPCVLFVGAAIDYSGASNLRSKLQLATDGTILQLCQIGGTPSQAQLNTAAATAMQGYMGDHAFTIDPPVATTNPREIAITTRAEYSTAIMKILGPARSRVPVNAYAKCNNQQQSYEIALALDNTGSMNNSGGGVSKIQALRTAATNFVNSVFADPSMSSTSKISLVPFAASVAVNPATYRAAWWVDTNGRASYHWNFVQGGAGTAATYASYVRSRLDVFDLVFRPLNASWDWSGCFESLPYPYNVQDGSPVSGTYDSYYVPMLAPDESGAGGEVSHADPINPALTIYTPNSYMDDANASGACPATTDEAVRAGRVCKYLQVTNARATDSYGGAIGPNKSCTTRPLTGLTTSQTTLISEISQMVANGRTNIHEGLMWGWRSLSPNSVLAQGTSYTTPYNNKVLVLMTDGFNYWGANSSNTTLKSEYSAYGYFKNPEGTTPNNRLLPANANPTTEAHARDALDALTLQGCANAKAAGIIVFTIGFTVSGDPIDQRGIDMLQTCASGPTRAYIATDATTIDTVFQKIRESIGKLRISQ